MVSLNSIILTTVTVFGAFNNYTFADNGLIIAKWDHAVNSKELLNAALKSDSTMIEGDVMLGNLNNADSKGDDQKPIMGHPPSEKSDLSLEEFLNKCEHSKKTVKLDFRSTEAFKAAIPIMEKSFKKFGPERQPWLHADILPGRGLEGQPVVDATTFIQDSAESFPNATLSLGWTTENWTGNKYTNRDIQDMFQLLSSNYYKPVTYEVKASLAANSLSELQFLLDNSPRGSTLTIWCNDKSEDLNFDGLVDLADDARVKSYGVYWVLPEEIFNKIVEKNNKKIPDPNLNNETTWNSFSEIFDELIIAKWEHAVNSKELLNAALNSDSTMIEGDVMLGNLDNADSINDDQIPIMGQPPAEKSDLSLEEFLNTCKDISHKRVKLDFKSTEAFKAAIPIMKKSFKKFGRKPWLHADILPGPGSGGITTVDANYFIPISKETFPDSMLSLGWITVVNKTEKKYTRVNINDMLKVLQSYNYEKPVTYAVKASLAANSVTELRILLDKSPLGSSLTIWCNDKSEDLNYDGLVDLADHLRVMSYRVYSDLPDEIFNKIVEKYNKKILDSYTPIRDRGSSDFTFV